MASTINATPTSSGLIQSADNTGILALQTGGTTAVTVDGSQNVGIGTSSPATKLDVNAGTSGRFRFTDSSGTLIDHINPAANAFVASYQRAASYGWGVGSGLPPSSMVLDASGNLLVGTTTRFDEKLTVRQSAATVGISIRSAASALGNYDSSDIDHAQYWTFGRENAVTGNFVFAATGVLKASINLTTGAYTAVSDSRLKKNITNINYGLNEVMAMRPVTYLMNEEEDTAKKHLGFIAQEIKEVVDEAVDDLINPDTQSYMLDKSGLVPVLVKAIQELNAKVDAQALEIQALKGVA